MDNHLRELRKSIRLTQKALGYQLGMSQQVISRIERQLDTITLDNLLALSDFYKVSIDYLLVRTAVELLNQRDRTLLWALIEKMLDDYKEA